MDMQENRPPRKPNPRRRQRTRLQVFKEAYLPVVILALSVVFIIIFIVGGSSGNGNTESTASSSTSSTTATQDPNQAALWAQEAKTLLVQAEKLAEDYDYAGALALLDTFSGDKEEFDELAMAYNHYKAADAALVSWTADQVPNLSFHLLIADPGRAFHDRELGASYKKNFITVREFSAILEQLYANGYVLVDLEQLYTAEFDPSTGREVFSQTVLRLPEGKKPLMLTEVNASYYVYMVDSNGDLAPDAGGDGFAHRLNVDDSVSGYRFFNDYVQADGTAAEGDYDMVPILESFIRQHPDFSFRDARATIAFTGTDGILGWRTNQNASEQEMAAKVARCLTDRGYRLACYTYGNIDYGSNSATQIQADLQKWNEQIAAVLGSNAGIIDTLVFARDGDIAGSEIYSGSKFTLLHNQGFRYFMGVSPAPWNQVNDQYIRHNRLMITGENLLKHPEMFDGLFNAAVVLDPERPTT